MITKSSIMLGMGETDEGLKKSVDELRAIDVDILTQGQYLQMSLQPTPLHLTVKEYVTPEKFAFWDEYGESVGFINMDDYTATKFFFSVYAFQVPSSYRAGELLVKTMVKERATTSASFGIS
ncbi:hypothetical protein SAY86_002654 [Trapa natans]|uniref:Uncharacterized protein n=1 Tax=Trapa natans TaxID=22666 RepID=A0AAN7LRD2_TRANT|nr:hypothetical protein SAY86_002654 [Trapa natans]